MTTVKGKEEGGWGGEDIDETMIDYVCLFLIERRANNSLWFHQSNCHTVCIYVVGNTVIPPPHHRVAFQFRRRFHPHPPTTTRDRSAQTPPYHCMSRRMKYAAVRSAIVDGTTMSHKSSFAVGYSPCETFSPTNRATIMKKLTNPGGLVFVMPCRNPNPSVTHATARAMRWPCVVMLRIILHANQLLASAGEFIILRRVKQSVSLVWQPVRQDLGKAHSPPHYQSKALVLSCELHQPQAFEPGLFCLIRSPERS